MKWRIGPSVDENVALGVCEQLVILPPNERCCVYDRLLFSLKERDEKSLAEALERHWKDHLNPNNRSPRKAGN